MGEGAGPVRAKPGLIDAVARLLDGANVVVRDLDGRILAWSTGCELLYGWKREEAVGRDGDELLGTVYPEPREAILDAVFQLGSWEGEIIQRDRHGGEIWVACRWVRLVDASEGEAPLLEIHSDISSLKEA